MEPPLGAITWSNNFLYNFISLPHHCGEILVHTSWQQCFSSLTLVGICLHTALLKSHQTISIGLRSGLWLGHCNTLILFFFSHSVVDLLVHLGSLSCCVTHFQPSFNCQSHGLAFYSRILWCLEEFIVDVIIVRHPGSVAAKQAQMINPPPPCLTVGKRRLFIYAVFGFQQT